MKKLLIILIVCLMLSSFVGAVPNPSSVYCHGMGYESETNETEKGQQGICIFPDGSKCSQWDFFRGKCGQEWSHCEKQGYGWKNLTQNQGWIRGGICINKTTGEEIDNSKSNFCKRAGESSYVFGCCDGLKEIAPFLAFDESCEMSGCTGCTNLCSDCGNGICEEWENKCNCQEDCKLDFFQKIINWFRGFFRK